MEVIECAVQDADHAAQLFNQYRMFYEQPDDLETARAFIRRNIEDRVSRVFLLLDEKQQALAFAQVYPATCSIAMKRFYWLYDLFVDPAARGAGHARQLMNHLTDLLRAEGADRISLDTALTNVVAQGLYESLGYEREGAFVTYHRYL